jgi:hypothetical protein
MRRKVTASLFALTIVLAVQALPRPEFTSAAAPKGRLGRVKGVITDTNNARIVTARILLDGDRVHRRLLTNAEGEFDVSLPPGKYLLTVDAPGFHDYVSPAFEVKSGKTQTLNIELHVAKPMGLVPAVSDPGPRMFD